MSRRRVVVTGLGCISPVGNTVAENWANLLAGQSGIGLITKFDASAFSCKIAGEVKAFQIGDYIAEKEGRHMDTFIHYGMAAACQAVADSGLPIGELLTEEQAVRIGCVIGSGIGGLHTTEEQHKILLAKGPGRVSPFMIPMLILNMSSGLFALYNNLRGPNFAHQASPMAWLLVAQAEHVAKFGPRRLL